MSAQRILLVENIHAVAKQRLEEEGYKVDLITHSPSEEELMQLLPNYEVGHPIQDGIDGQSP